MITPAHAQLMARYNRWQNESLYRAAGRLSDAERHAQRGAYFGSIHATLTHMAFADRAWLWRLTGDATLKPTATSMSESVTAFPVWVDLAAKRQALDSAIITWADGLTSADLEGDLTYHSVATGTSFTKPRWLLVTHLFNHQTHHRGQVHCLLTQAGLSPDDTDIPLMA
jgi:uncharacterized damage-inducible protein DinB